jgi:hypothetical protein
MSAMQCSVHSFTVSARALSISARITGVCTPA